MKLFSADTNSGMIWKFSGWFGMNFNQKLSPGYSFKIKKLNPNPFFFNRVFNKVKSRSAHMKSHRPMPSPDLTGQESKRPSAQHQQNTQNSQSLQQNLQQNLQQTHGSSLPQEFNGCESNVPNSTHLWHNPMRLRPP